QRAALYGRGEARSDDRPRDRRPRALGSALHTPLRRPGLVTPGQLPGEPIRVRALRPDVGPIAPAAGSAWVLGIQMGEYAPRPTRHGRSFPSSNARAGALSTLTASLRIA